MSTANDLCILTATLDDWDSVLVLLSELNDTLDAADLRATVVVIDDGSSVFVEPEQFPVKDWANIIEVRVVTLYRNLGNQRAVSVGFGYIATELPGLPVVLMDADLEDQPKYLPVLIEKMREADNKIVFAERSERSEGHSFRLFYGVYQRLYKMLTGLPISIGNYSAIPAKLVPRVASISEIASHFPAGIMRARVPYTTIHSVRGTRRFGESKMRLVSLIIHGLSGFAVHADVVGVRIVLGILATIAVIAGIVGVLIFQKLFTDIHIIGWTSQIVVLLISFMAQIFVAAIFIVFLVLANRNQTSFMPIADHDKFIMDVLRLS